LCRDEPSGRQAVALTTSRAIPYKRPEFRHRRPLRGETFVHESVAAQGPVRTTRSIRHRAATSGDYSRETDLSTKQARAQAPPRFPCAHGDHGRPQGHLGPSSARSQAPQRLIRNGPEGRSGMQRLRQRADFLAAAGGLKVPSAGFVLQARDRSDQAPARVGFTVSRKVGNAVERNRVRRRLREVVRLQSRQALRPGHDYVLVGRRAALSAVFSDLAADYDRAITRIHTMRPRPKPHQVPPGPVS
jgi:ribonuclease P protein component